MYSLGERVTTLGRSLWWFTIYLCVVVDSQLFLYKEGRFLTRESLVARTREAFSSSGIDASTRSIVVPLQHFKPMLVAQRFKCSYRGGLKRIRATLNPRQSTGSFLWVYSSAVNLYSYSIGYSFMMYVMVILKHCLLHFPYQLMKFVYWMDNKVSTLRRPSKKGISHLRILFIGVRHVNETVCGSR